MESVDFIQRRREALEWWRSLSPTQYEELRKTNTWMYGRPPSSLTGREIEAIWKAEVQK